MTNDVEKPRDHCRTHSQLTGKDAIIEAALSEMTDRRWCR